MKQTKVPAQVTTHEDKIAGSLTLTQLLLLISPVLLDLLLFISLPKPMKLNLAKLILMAICLMSGAGAAIRIRGRLVINWALLLIRYNQRPTYYVFDKNSAYLRQTWQENRREITETTPAQRNVKKRARSNSDKSEVNRLIGSANLNFTFHKKRGLNVSISKVD